MVFIFLLEFDLLSCEEYIECIVEVFDFIVEEKFVVFEYVILVDDDFWSIFKFFIDLFCLFNGFMIVFEVWGRDGCDFEVCLIGIFVLFWIDFFEEIFDCIFIDFVDNVCLFILLMLFGCDTFFFEFIFRWFVEVDIIRELFIFEIFLDCIVWEIRDFGNVFVELVLLGLIGFCRDDTEEFFFVWIRFVILMCLIFGLEGVVGNFVFILVWGAVFLFWVDGT